ncbi:hypothetical protein C8R44DRAFT_738059 [Mycena epipterygia]|nr:hypothetical protein C8R44DRAFT_738059 [Mycena epipterygia]
MEVRLVSARSGILSIPAYRYSISVSFARDNHPEDGVLSISSSQMTDNAQELLSIQSMLPDGLSDPDLVQSTLSIAKILSAKATLLRISLAFVRNKKRPKLLAPIREYVTSVHPPPNTLKVPIRIYFHKTLELWDSFENMQLSQER